MIDEREDPTLTVEWARQWLIAAEPDFDRAEFMDHVERILVGNIAAADPRAAQPATPTSTLARSVMTSASLPGVAKPKMEVNISFRVKRDLREAAQAKANERQENVSDVLRDALERYIKSKP